MPLPNESLEHVFTQCGIAWQVIALARHKTLEAEWFAAYRDVWKLRMRHKHGIGAQAEYAQRSSGEFLIVPFLGERAGPHGIGKRGPRTTAYECKGSGALPDLSSFADLDFFIAPPDLRWTMLHTHEDYALGGPYFIDKEWLVPPIRMTGNRKRM